MPYINVKLAGPEPTKEQKAEMIKQMTQTMVDVLGKNPQRVMVMIETLEPESIGVGGESVESIAKKVQK